MLFYLKRAYFAIPCPYVFCPFIYVRASSLVRHDSVQSVSQERHRAPYSKQVTYSYPSLQGGGLFRLLAAIDNQKRLSNTLLVTLEPRVTKRVLRSCFLVVYRRCFCDRCRPNFWTAAKSCFDGCHNRTCITKRIQV